MSDDSADVSELMPTGPTWLQLRDSTNTVRHEKWAAAPYRRDRPLVRCIHSFYPKLEHAVNYHGQTTTVNSRKDKTSPFSLRGCKMGKVGADKVHIYDLRFEDVREMSIERELAMVMPPSGIRSF